MRVVVHYPDDVIDQYPALRRIAYGSGGAHLNRSELAVEAADALERIASLAAELKAVKSHNAKENAS